MKKKDAFDPNAEARYISLDSAVLEARRLARQDDDRYRGRLGWDEIVWTELESQHRDDSYRVVLQFRTPTRDLEQEQTGEEEFVFDLLGTLLDRQVLVWPVGYAGPRPAEPILSRPADRSAGPPSTPEGPAPAPSEASERPQVRPEADVMPYITLLCEDCGNTFPARRKRRIALCKTCAEKRRAEGRGPVQLARRG